MIEGEKTNIISRTISKDKIETEPFVGKKTNSIYKLLNSTIENISNSVDVITKNAIHRYTYEIGDRIGEIELDDEINPTINKFSKYDLEDIIYSLSFNGDDGIFSTLARQAIKEDLEKYKNDLHYRTYYKKYIKGIVKEQPNIIYGTTSNKRIDRRDTKIYHKYSNKTHRWNPVEITRDKKNNYYSIVDFYEDAYLKKNFLNQYKYLDNVEERIEKHNNKHTFIKIYPDDNSARLRIFNADGKNYKDIEYNLDGLIKKYPDLYKKLSNKNEKLPDKNLIKIFVKKKDIPNTETKQKYQFNPNNKLSNDFNIPTTQISNGNKNPNAEYRVTIPLEGYEHLQGGKITQENGKYVITENNGHRNIYSPEKFKHVVWAYRNMGNDSEIRLRKFSPYKNKPQKIIDFINNK